jgi:hypothetical protein
MEKNRQWFSPWRHAWVVQLVQNEISLSCPEKTGGLSGIAVLLAAAVCAAAIFLKTPLEGKEYAWLVMGFLLLCWGILFAKYLLGWRWPAVEGAEKEAGLLEISAFLEASFFTLLFDFWISAKGIERIALFLICGITAYVVFFWITFFVARQGKRMRR